MGTLKLYRTGIGWEVIGVAPRGVPGGGATNALLAKATTADGDIVWTTAPVVSSITMSDGANMVCGSTTGTKFGTATTQKIGFWNATPVAQNTGWSVTAGYTADKQFNPEATTVTELARALGTLIDTLKIYGLLGG